MKVVKDIGEFGLIERLNQLLPAGNNVFAGIGDDSAVVAFDKKKYMLLTTDMIIEGAHYTKNDAPYDIGHKALACNISDIAAMGGVPQYALVSLGVSPKASIKRIENLYRGMKDLARRFNVDIVGGDTVKSEKEIINVALVGQVEKNNLVLRRGAKPKDLIFVSGPLGNSFKSKHHLKFTPRVREAQFLVKHFKPSAMIDISDGLLADLEHILKASSVGARLMAARIPRRGGCDLSRAFYDGEDFELLFTLPAAKANRLMKTKTFPFFCIGEIISQKRVEMIAGSGKIQTLTVIGFQHF